MSVDLTTYRFEKDQRVGGIAFTAIGAIAIILCGAVAELRDVGLWGTGPAALLSFVGLFLNLETKPGDIKLRDLDADGRANALALAWQNIFVNVSPVPWAFIALSTQIVVAILFHEVSLDAGARAGISIVAAVAPACVALVRQTYFAEPFVEKLALRSAGVNFILAHAEQWTMQAADVLCDKTAACFRQKDPKKAVYALWLPNEKSQLVRDLPARCVNFMHLAVGEFIGVRGGPFLDIKETAERHAGQQDPDRVAPQCLAIGEDTNLHMEREAHYTDVVNIEYKRSNAMLNGAPTGMFELGLTNGARINYATLETGPAVQAAIEHIRDRTRKAKAR